MSANKTCTNTPTPSKTEPPSCSHVDRQTHIQKHKRTASSKMDYHKDYSDQAKSQSFARHVIYLYVQRHWRSLAATIFLVLFVHALLQRNKTLRVRHNGSHNGDTEASQDTIFLPYIEPFSSAEVPQVKTTVDGVEIEMPIDTGSTGTLIGAPLLPNVDPSQGIPAYQYFSSSHILYNGRLVNLPITFHGEGETAVATVPVLVVDRSFRCPWYDLAVDKFDCPPNPDGPDPVPRDVSKITYMGIGFGRNRRGREQLNTLPSANPFLNVANINGRPVSRRWQAGYVISTKGVHLGLSKENTAGFAWTNLSPGLTHDIDVRDWAMVNASFRGNDGVINRGSALVDTGVAQMYLRTERGAAMPTITIPNPNKDGYAAFVKRVRPGTKLAVGFPSLGEEAAAEYSFEVGSTAKAAPSYVVPLQRGSSVYINTGRHFFFGYSIAFDAVRGRFGFRRV